MDLQPPSVLAQLPRPLNAAASKIHAGEVIGLGDSRKRKRYEVAFAVDGEAVNIYNVCARQDGRDQAARLLETFAKSKSDTGTNTENDYFVCCSTTVHILLLAVISSPKVVRKGARKEADLRCAGAAGATGPVLR